MSHSLISLLTGMWFGLCRCTIQELELTPRYFDPSVSVRQTYASSCLDQQVCLLAGVNQIQMWLNILLIFTIIMLEK